MGCTASSTEQQAVVVSNKIDEELKKDRKQGRKEKKILLLGASESGRSTMVKQMQIIHNGGYSVEECKEYRPIVYANTIQSLFTILQEMKKLEIEFSNKSRLQDVKMFCEITGNSVEEEITYELGEIMVRLWHDEGLQRCFAQSRDYQLNNSAGYYLNALTRISDPHYIPTEQDVLKTRVKYTGITQLQFKYMDLFFKIIDVGCQRSSIKKWLHCFEDVTGIIFFTSLSDYDLVLEEGVEINRMVHSMNLFHSICHSKWFHNTTIVLFLNKKDLFEEKIQHSPITICFPEYDGPTTYKESIEYIQTRFESMNEKRMTYTLLTCATDTKHIKTIFSYVTDLIVQQANLINVGLM